jgi:hypothetical protein
MEWNILFDFFPDFDIIRNNKSTWAANTRELEKEKEYESMGYGSYWKL